jgi:hypothetical protein
VASRGRHGAALARPGRAGGGAPRTELVPAGLDGADLAVEIVAAGKLTRFERDSTGDWIRHTGQHSHSANANAHVADPAQARVIAAALAAPQLTLKEIRKLLKPDGSLFIIEPRAADKLEDNINPIATMLYGFSIFHCTTQSLAQGGPGLGTCMGPARTEALLRDAGFRGFQQLDIKSPTNLFTLRA